MHAPAKLPGYELLKPLGGGPLTFVYAAQDLARGEPCAVKMLRDEWQDEPTAIKLFRREARAGLAVRHRHLVRLLDAHVTRAPYYLVLELLPGESLRQRLKRAYRLEPPAALWMIRQTAEALAALHRAGFVHGDVKPENIRLIGDGNVKLIDLGFAHRPGENQPLLEQGYVLGTVDYLAPELCGLDADGDDRSDLFSLGVTLFEMLAGRLPYACGTTRQVLARHRSEPPSDIRSLVPDLSSGLAGLVERLLARRPEDRPRARTLVQQLIALEIATLRSRRSA
jgi:eukaryotic-like serine/threonine-protein kinase